MILRENLLTLLKFYASLWDRKVRMAHPYRVNSAHSEFLHGLLLSSHTHPNIQAAPCCPDDTHSSLTLLLLR